MASQAGTTGMANSPNRYTPGNTPPASAVGENVKQLEARYQSKVSKEGPSGNSCWRPAYGTTGKSTEVWANYFELRLNPNQTIYKCDITVEPKAEDRKLRRVIELLFKQPGLSGSPFFTDFKKIMILRECENIREPRAFNVQYYPEDQQEAGPRAPIYHVRITPRNVLSVQELLDAVGDPDKPYVLKEAIIHALNTMLHHHPQSLEQIAVVGNGAFPLSGDLSDIRELGGGVQALRGFFSSVRPAAGRMLINVNINWKPFYTPGNLYELHFRQYRSLRTDNAIQVFGRSLEGIRVTRLNGGSLARPICGLAATDDGFSPRGQSVDARQRPQVRKYAADSQNVRFWLDAQNRYVTIREYFEKHLKLQLQHPDLPVVNVGSKSAPIYWLPELCTIVPGQPVRGPLSAEQTSKMIKCAVRKPAENFALIERHGSSIVGLSTSSPFMDPNYVRVDQSLITAEGRILDKPKLKYTRDISFQGGAAWNARGHKFNLPGRLRSWTYLYIEVNGFPSAFNGPSAKTDFEAARDHFQRGLTAPGITVAPQGYSPGHRINLHNEDDEKLEAILKIAVSTGFDLVWVLIPTGMRTLYDRIKYLGDVKFGLATMVSVDAKVAKQQGRDQYFGNEALKANLKLNGRNQIVASHLYFVNDRYDTMILGADVTHPSTDQRKSKLPSVAGLVMCDKHLAHYRGVLSLQNKRQEMISRLGEMVKRMVLKWKAIHNVLPRNILMYRDGVSEGQYEMVRDQELSLIRKECWPIYESARLPQPRITIIIVTKRHHTRFAPKHNADTKANCQAGLVVDRSITDMSLWDFFLQPHSTLQGAARPGYYVVIHDEIFRPYAQATKQNPADVCQDLTQSLCYTFGRAVRAVGICTPAYFADILCERANSYLRTLPNGAFDNLYDMTSDSGGSTYQISDHDRERLQAHIQTNPRLEDTMFFI